MSGKPTVWTAERQAWLIGAVRDHVIRAGRVDWARIAHAGSVSVHGARMQYQDLNRKGRAPLLSVLLAESLAGKLEGRQTTAPAAEPEQKVETKTTESGMESTAVGQHIRTVDDLLKHIGADLTRYEIDKFEATKWDGHSKDPEGKAKVTELHRVWVRLKPKAGPTTQEVVEGVIAAAFASRKALPAPRLPRAASPDILQAIIVADPHHGKHAWDAETGWGDYDLGISTQLQAAAGGELVTAGNNRKPALRLIGVLGDYFHYDTPTGTTTKGTPLERDGRVQKMIDEGARVLFDLIDASAETVPTHVVLVPGNHDQVLSWALQRILQSHYRHSKRVTVDAEYTGRKYQRWGKVLLGLTHGDRARKSLPQLMARERPVDWGETTYREIHTGHLHEAAAIQTIDGVITRTAPSLSAPDAWHAGEGFVGSLRAMESFYYHRDGALLGMDVAAPRVKHKARRAA